MKERLGQVLPDVDRPEQRLAAQETNRRRRLEQPRDPLVGALLILDADAEPDVLQRPGRLGVAAVETFPLELPPHVLGRPAVAAGALCDLARQAVTVRRGARAEVLEHAHRPFGEYLIPMARRH